MPKAAYLSPASGTDFVGAARPNSVPIRRTSPPTTSPGAVLAGLATLAYPGLPPVTKVAGAAAVLALVAAAVLLLFVVRSHLRGTDRASFPYRAGLDDDTLRASLRKDARPARIRILSTIAVRKYTQLRHAV